MCITCILIPVLVGLVCAVLGYLLGQYLSKKASDITISLLQTELETCRSKSTEFQSTINGLKNEISELKIKVASELPIFDAAAAAKVFGKKVNLDDLKIVEGIGPKIEELFHNAGIKTWKALSETSVEKCKQILENAGERFIMHDPSTWPRQCELARQGKWQELKDWQDKLDGGKEHQ
jgi:predicted flap endonuclease-1-like 5' DNA nuclease